MTTFLPATVARVKGFSFSAVLTHPSGPPPDRQCARDGPIVARRNAASTAITSIIAKLQRTPATRDGQGSCDARPYAATAAGRKGQSVYYYHFSAKSKQAYQSTTITDSWVSKSLTMGG